MILEPVKIMPILNQGRFAQTSFPAKKIKEAGGNVRERIRQCDLVLVRKNKPK
jgi:hypothetical protein